MHFCDKLCVFRQKSRNKTTTTKPKFKHDNHCRSRVLNPGPLTLKADALPQLKISIVVKLFNCFKAMDRNVNKQGRICGPHIFNIFFVICFHAYLVVSHIHGSMFHCLTMVKM